MSAQYPDVPDAPGVPPVNRDPNAPAASAPPPLSQDDPSVSDNSATPKWGIYDDNGQAVVEPDSVISWEYVEEYKILDYPLEKGAFESYNKVSLPFQGRMVCAKGGSEQDQADFLDDVKAIVGDLNLYTAYTPQATYPGANARRYNYRRTRENGSNLTIAEIWLEQVRVTVTANLASTKSPSAQDATNGGPVQGQSVTPAQMAQIINGPMQSVVTPPT